MLCMRFVHNIHHVLDLHTCVVLQFSLRGKWPAERYQRILELQMCGSHLGLCYSVAHHGTCTAKYRAYCLI